MREVVHCIGRTDAAPDDVWAVGADFDVAWHPMVATSTMEPPTCGQIVRRFSAADDNTVVRERLTYINQSNRTLAYTMLAASFGQPVTLYDLDPVTWCILSL